MHYIEHYRCNDCGLEFGVSEVFPLAETPSWANVSPLCPRCGSYLNVEETTNNEYEKARRN